MGTMIIALQQKSRYATACAVAAALHLRRWGASSDSLLMLVGFLGSSYATGTTKRRLNKNMHLIDGRIKCSERLKHPMAFLSCALYRMRLVTANEVHPATVSHTLLHFDHPGRM